MLGLKSGLGAPSSSAISPPVVSSSAPLPVASPPPGIATPSKPVSAAPPGLISSSSSKFESDIQQRVDMVSQSSALPAAPLRSITVSSEPSSLLRSPVSSTPPGLLPHSTNPVLSTSSSATNSNYMSDSLLSAYIPLVGSSNSSVLSASTQLGSTALDLDQNAGDFGLALSTMRALNIDDTSRGNSTGLLSKSPPPGFGPVMSFATSSPPPPASTSVTPINHSNSDKQKAAALLSMMKSRVGDITVKRTTAPAPGLTQPVLSGSPPNTVEVTSIDNAEPSDSNANGTAGTQSGLPVAKKVLTFRIVRNQTASLHVKVRNYKTKEESRIPVGYYFRPSNGMTIEWRMPASLAEKYLRAANGHHSSEDSNGESNDAGGKDAAKSQLVIGLLRYGTASNAGCLIAKNINVTHRQRTVDSITGEVFYQGEISFFAPKSAGQFVYRLFDQSTKESVFDTLGTSFMFHVVLVDHDIVNNLPVVVDSMEKETNFAKGVAQLSQLVRGLKSCSPECANQVVPLFNKSVELILDEINRTMPILDEGYEKKKLVATTSATASSAVDVSTTLEGEPSATPVAAGNTAVNAEDAEFWSSYRIAAKLHLDAFDCFQLLQEKRNAWYLLSEKLKNSILFVQRLFCSILRRYFANVSDMAHRRLDHLQFVPAMDTSRVLPQPIQLAMSQAILNTASRLLPKPDFMERREKIRDMMERQLYLARILPVDSHLALYGSSANAFGKEDADLDMCLVLPDDVSSSQPGLYTGKGTNNAGSTTETDAETEALRQQARLTILEKIADTLIGQLGMTNVSTRLTARIPIVEFHDPLTQLDGDISLHNSLALANTKMLRVYAEIDPRVRCLAYIIKHWAKNRQLNSPQDGTLSSYGFLLSLIHFLQRRPVPVLPCLQQLPPDWMGQPTVSPCPSVWATSIDGSKCNVYFLQPNRQQMQLLNSKAAENKETVAQLLMEYFRYFAWTFETRNDVVSIRRWSSPAQPPAQHQHHHHHHQGNVQQNVNTPVTKYDKYEESAWFHTDVLSIEDPFETGYDVAHVLRAAQMSYLRKEFLRAYTLACRTISPSLDTAVLPPPHSPMLLPPDALPNYVSPLNFVDVLCEPSETPAFVGRRKASSSITETAAFGSTSLLQMLAASAAPSSAAAAVLSEVLPSSSGNVSTSNFKK